MADFDDLVGKNIDDLGQAMRGFGRGQVAALEMSVPVEMIARLCHTEEPVDRF